MRYIQVLRTVLSDVTQAVSGKTIAESTKIRQLHTDRMSHKGTEIVNIVCSILNKDNQLKNHLYIWRHHPIGRYCRLSKRGHHKSVLQNQAAAREMVQRDSQNVRQS